MTDEVKNLGEPLTLEQMRGMRGKWAWIVSCDESKPFFGWGLVGKHHASTLQEYDEDLAVRVNYDVEEYGSVWLAYRYPPATIDLDDWTTHWVERERHAGGFHEETGRIVPAPGILSEEKATVLVDGRHTYKGLYCAKCGAAAADTFMDICPRCGRAATKEGLAILEKRLGVCLG